jgi:hypothetical protein
MNNTKLAELIAEDIMQCGDEPNSPTTRIQFMSGLWSEGNEKPQGGLCKVALANLIQATLDAQRKGKSK